MVNSAPLSFFLHARSPHTCLPSPCDLLTAAWHLDVGGDLVYTMLLFFSFSGCCEGMFFRVLCDDASFAMLPAARERQGSSTLCCTARTTTLTAPQG